MNAMRNLATVCLFLVCLLTLPAAAQADGAQSPSPESSPVVWSAEAKITKLFDSYTSYEFGNPVEPYQAPLSRLEFALNTWWGGVELKRWTPRWSIGLEALTNIQNGVDGKMADSDWTDGDHPKVRDIYSESNLRLKPSYMVNASADVSVKPWLPLPKGLDLRPTGGIRWQFFDLMAFDGTQWATYPDGSVDTMPPVRRFDSFQADVLALLRGPAPGLAAHAPGQARSQAAGPGGLGLCDGQQHRSSPAQGWHPHHRGTHRRRGLACLPGPGGPGL